MTSSTVPSQSALSCYQGRQMPHVLLVDDSIVTRQITQLLLATAEWTVEVVENGAQAVSAVRSAQATSGFDLILMDLDLPVMNGFAAAKAIQTLERQETRSTPILALTGLKDAAANVEAAGMIGILAKPYHPFTFVAEVTRFLAAAHAAKNSAECRPIAGSVWDRKPFEDLKDRLGGERMSQALVMFEVRLIRVRAALQASLDDGELMAREAHGLVSSAGMLGFKQLTAVGQIAQRWTDGTPSRAIVLTLLAAVERALVEVSAVNVVVVPSCDGL